MRRVMVVLVAAALLVPAALTAQEEGPPRGRPRMEAQERRRAELERQIRRRFMMQLGRRLELSEDQRSRLRTLLEEGAESRRALALESRSLRSELMRAAGDSATPLSTYEGILTRLKDLRKREQALEEREDAALSGFLDARQQALFLMMRLQLNDRVRRIQGGPPGDRGPGGGPGGGGAGMGARSGGPGPPVGMGPGPWS